MGRAEPLRVLVADDNKVFREGMLALLGSSDDIDLLGAVSNAADAIQAAGKLDPDVVLMDLGMPGGGVEATSVISDASPHVAVLVLTMHEDEEAVLGALRAGARGYLLKGARRAELLRAINAVADGGAVFSPTIAARLMKMSRGAGSSTVQQFPELTPREREILELVARGRTNPEIADELVLSDKTVRNHVSSILGKLRVPGRPQAIVKAREAGVGERGA